MSVCERLREERKKTGLTQAEFASLAGIGLTSQKNYEAGRSNPDTAYLEKVKGMVDVAYIISGDKSSEQIKEEGAQYIVSGLDKEVSAQAYRITERLLTMMDVKDEQKYEWPHYIYGLLMTLYKGYDDDQVIGEFVRLGVAKQKAD